METLILKETHCETPYCLKDASGNLLGWFKTVADGKAWCRENGYLIRVDPLNINKPLNYAKQAQSLRDLREYDKRNPGRMAEEA